jgi:hypothetical protein
VKSGAGTPAHLNKLKINTGSLFANASGNILRWIILNLNVIHPRFGLLTLNNLLRFPDDFAGYMWFFRWLLGCSFTLNPCL